MKPTDHNIPPCFVYLTLTEDGCALTLWLVPRKHFNVRVTTLLLVYSWHIWW